MKIKDLKSMIGGRVKILDSNMDLIVDLWAFNNVFIIRPELADCEIEGLYPHVDHKALCESPDAVYNYGTVVTEIVIRRES